MALPFEAEPAMLRRSNREKLQRAVACLPRTSDVASFLADMAHHVLNLQMRLEDTLLLAESIVADASSVQQKDDTMLSLRAVVPAVQELYGKIYMAAITDCASVVETMQVPEDVPGLTAAQVKAIKERHAKRTLLRKMEESNVQCHQGLPLRHPAAVTVTYIVQVAGRAGRLAGPKAGRSCYLAVLEAAGRACYLTCPEAAGSACYLACPEAAGRAYYRYWYLTGSAAGLSHSSFTSRGFK